MTSAWLRRLWAWATAPKDIAAWVAFRIAFGLMITVSAVRFLAYGWVDTLFIRPSFQFTYWGFSWLPVAPAEAMYALFAAIAFLGLCVATGFYYRWATALLALAFTYVQLVDVTNYLNHYYLVSLLTALMFAVPAHRAFSFDVWRRPALRQSALAAGYTYLLRFQVGVVYLFAGLAKFNSDWLLHAQPLSIWLSARTSLPVVGPYLAEAWVAYLAAWFGFLFDTSIVAFLLMHRTRAFAYLMVLVFHTATALLFPIGMFPVIMSIAAWAFFDPSWPRRWLRFVGPYRPPTSWTPLALTGAARGVPVLVGLYVLWQLLMPLRAHAYGEAVSWHEQGMRYSWRVMTREKNGSVTFIVRDPATQREWHIPPRKYLSSLQERELSVQPDLILQLAHHIAKDFEKRGTHVQVFADSRVSWNGRPAASFIHPDVDLTQVEDGWSPKAWIAPAPSQPPPTPKL